MVRVARDLKDPLVPSPYHRQRCHSDQVAQGSIQSLLPGMGHPHFFWATCSYASPPLSLQDFFLLSNLNLLSFSLKPLSLTLSLSAHIKTLSLLFISLRKLWNITMWCPQSLLLSRLKQPQVSQPVSVWEAFHLSVYLCGSSVPF